MGIATGRPRVPEFLLFWAPGISMFSLLAYFAGGGAGGLKDDHTNEDWPEYTGQFSVSYDPDVSFTIHSDNFMVT